MTHTKKTHDQIAALLLGECEEAAYKLFTKIMRRHGLAEARRVFLKLGTPPSGRKLGKIRNYALLDRYDMMPEPNVQRLARELVKENETSSITLVKCFHIRYHTSNS
jgi:hypothetical protein